MSVSALASVLALAFKYTHFLTQHKSALELKACSKCFCQKALFSLMLQPTD